MADFAKHGYQRKLDRLNKRISEIEGTKLQSDDTRKTSRVNRINPEGKSTFAVKRPASIPGGKDLDIMSQPKDIPGATSPRDRRTHVRRGKSEDLIVQMNGLHLNGLPGDKGGIDTDDRWQENAEDSGRPRDRSSNASSGIEPDDVFEEGSPGRTQLQNRNNRVPGRTDEPLAGAGLDTEPSSSNPDPFQTRPLPRICTPQGDFDTMPDSPPYDKPQSLQDAFSRTRSTGGESPPGITTSSFFAAQRHMRNFHGSGGVAGSRSLEALLGCSPPNRILMAKDPIQPSRGSISDIHSETNSVCSPDSEETDSFSLEPMQRPRSRTWSAETRAKQRRVRVRSLHRPPTPPPLNITTERQLSREKLKMSDVDIMELPENMP